MKWLRWAALLFLVVATARGFWLLGGRVLYDMRGAWEGDGDIYLTVGRGILHGLLPYRDLFETKPPGIFLLSALSIWLTGDRDALHVVQGLVEMGFLAAFLFGVWRMSRRQVMMRQILLLVLAALVGIVLVLFMATRAGGVQTESFGAVFCVAYFALFCEPGERFTKLQTALATVLLLCAVGLKEPFLWVVLAGVLVLRPARQRLLRRFLLPLCYAAVVGFCAMLALRFLEPYVSVYLPEMLWGLQKSFGPSWLRGFILPMVVDDLWKFSPLLVGLCGALWLGAILTRLEDPSRQEIVLACVWCAVIAGVLFLFLKIAPYLYYTRLLSAEVLLGLIIVFWLTVAFAIRQSARFFLERHDAAAFTHTVLLHTASLYILCYAIGLGGNTAPHHFALVAPVCIAWTLALVLSIVSRQWNILEGILLVCIACTAGFLLLLWPRPDYEHMLLDARETRSSVATDASQVDTVLDLCGVDRYLLIGLSGIYGYTRHSPMGPAFFQASLNFKVPWRAPSPFFRNTFADNLNGASIVLLPMDPGDRAPPEDVQAFIDEYFTTTMPPCARGAAIPPTIRMFFRKGHAFLWDQPHS